MIRSALVLALTTCLVGTTDLAAQHVRFTFNGASTSAGNAPADQAGESVALIGDVDGDGYADIVVGVPEDAASSGGAGAVRLHSGRTGERLRLWTGDAPGNVFGLSVANAGDVDGDGVDDVVVGAPGVTSLGQTGYARILSGADGTTLLTLTAGAPGTAFGTAVDGVGDVDGDGTPDLIVGAPLTPGSGAAFVRSGATGALLHTLSSPTGSAFGFAARGAGDVDGDGTPDLIVGSLSDSAYLFSGADGSLIVEIVGFPGSLLGAAVDGVGDVDGDGFDDVIVGSPTNNGTNGGAQVISGQTHAVLHYAGASAGDAFGIAVAGLGDFTGDGVPDFAVGGPGNTLASDREGRVRVYSGADGALVLERQGNAFGDLFGLAVAGGGDVNRDGRGDLVVGAPAAAPSHPVNASYARVVLSDGLPPATERWSEAGLVGPNERWGTSLAILDDLDGDGVDDLAVGVPGQSSPGRVDVRSGSDGTVLMTVNGGASSLRFGETLAAVPDVNGDGRRDLLVSESSNPIRATLHSGLTGSLLFTFLAPNQGAFGHAMAAVGDGNGDGVEDVAIGDSVFADVFVYSGADGSLIRSIDRSSGSNQFGAALTGIGDVDGDGRGDFAVGNPADASAAVEAISGATGLTLWTAPNPLASTAMGAALARLPDVDGDGQDDVLVGAPAFSSGTAFGAVHVLSGATGVALATHLDDSTSLRFGFAVAAPGDVDRDGVADLLVGCPSETHGGRLGGEFRLLSGRDGTLLVNVGGPGRSELGHAVAGADLDHDGIIELIAGAPAPDSIPADPNPTAPFVGVWSAFGATNPHAGSIEDLRFTITVNGAAPTRAGTRPVAVGDFVEMAIASPLGTFVGQDLYLLLQTYPTPRPPTPIAGFDELRVNPFAATTPGYGPVLSLLPAGLLGTPTVPAPGLSLGATVLPGFAGISVMLQPLVVTSAARNGFFATANGQALEL